MSTGKLEKIRRLSEYLRSLDESELPLAAIWLTGPRIRAMRRSSAECGLGRHLRALLAASGIPEANLRAIGRKHNDGGMTAAEVMRAKPGTARSRCANSERFLNACAAARGPVLKTEILAGSPSSRSPRWPPATWSGFLPATFASA